MSAQYVELSPHSIVVRDRVRKSAGDLATLEGSIRHVGLLCPVLVDRNNVLVAGFRRLEACRRLGLERIPALKLDIEADSMTALNVQADENLCREPLSADEFDRLIRLKKSALDESAVRPRPGLRSALKRLFGT